MVDQLLYQVANFIAGLAQQVQQYANATIGSIVNWMRNWASSIFSWVTETFSRIINWTQAIFAQLHNMVSSLIGAIQNVAFALFDKISQLVNFAMNGIAHVVNAITAKITAMMDSIVNTVRGWVTSTQNWIKSVIDTTVQGVKDLINAVINTVKGWVDNALKFVLEAYNKAIKGIEQGIQAMLGATNSLVNAIGQKLIDIRQAFKDSAIEVTKAISGLETKAFGPIAKSLEALIEPYVDIMSIADVAALNLDMRRLVEGKVGLPEYRQFIGAGMAKIAKASPPMAAVFTLMVLYSGMNATIGKLADVYTKPIIQEIAAVAPFEIMSPIDIAAAWRRGFVTEQRAVEVIRRQGFTVDDANVILRLADTVPAEFELVAMELRGVISPQETNEALRVRGFSQEWANKIRRMGEIIPPVADLITMAVREAFSPDVAARFGQFDDFPQPFAEWAQKQGLSAEWARRYWAAHWSLPSPTQGFEMFQRRIISEDDLHLLLRALDIMPFWRDKLTQLAYNPLTRVDVRRMHQMGVLSDQDVYNSYLDIGYSPANAARLQEFTLALNKGQQPVDDEELGRLTRQQVLNFYDAGLITKEKTLEYLTGMGITPDAAILYVRSVDANEQLAIRKADADFIVEQAQAGILSFDEAQDKLTSMGLEPVEVRRAINKLVRLLATRTKLPSRTEAESMLLKGIITIEVYRDLLGRLGYAEHWVNAYTALVGEKINANRGKDED